MRLILISILLLQTLISHAQPGVSPERDIDGKRYYVHEVVAGNTLWGLQRMYGVEVTEIMTSNPGLSEGLKVGQTVLVPIPSDSNVEPTKQETQEYKVRRGETLYGLSRKFNTTVDALIELNPILSTSALQKGQVIRVPGSGNNSFPEDSEELTEEAIPNPFTLDTVKVDEETSEVIQVAFNDSIVEHKVLAHETMYSISKRFMVPIETILKVNSLSSTKLAEGQVLRIPVKQERIEKLTVKDVPPKYDPYGTDSIVFDLKERYKIAVLLPFFLDHGPGFSEYVSDVSTQFYMGMTLASDTLEKLGLNADIHYFDTRRDSASVVKLLNSEKFKDVDLVIGPFFANTQQLVADYCRRNAIRMVIPVRANMSLLENNRLVHTAIPSDITLMEQMAVYVANAHSDDRVILVKPLKKEDMPLYEAFRDAYNRTKTERPKAALNETTMEGMKNLMTRNTDNIIILPSNNSYNADRFVSAVSRSDFRARKDGIYIYGTKEWVDFNAINNDFKNKYNFRFVSHTFLDYYTDQMVELNKTFRLRYETDMSKFAVQGYDILLSFCSSFFMEDTPVRLMANSFNLRQISPADGYENTHVYVIEQEDFELINIEESVDE
jgi:LysM repeat protein